MNTLPWQMQKSVDAIIFDCDGTLTAIEGIDELARFNHVFEPVQQMTQLAMEKGQLNEWLYADRLNLVKPTRAQVESLAQEYIFHQTPHAVEVIKLLQGLNKQVYILSAGITLAVSAFGTNLGINKKNIFAVDVHFDPVGNYLDFDRKTPLINSDGKCKIISLLKEKHETMVMIGDGMNDFATYSMVDRFIGFGGYYYRQSIKDKSDFYLHHSDLSPLLPLILTSKEIMQLDPIASYLYEKGLKLINDEQVTINNHLLMKIEE